MFTETSAEGASKPAPFKKSLFNKPAWSKPQTPGDPLDFFHRSRQTYVDIAAEEERKRKRRLARKDEERARVANTEEREGKRRRVADYSDDDDEQSSSGSDYGELAKPSAPKVQTVDGQKSPSPKRQQISPKSLLKQYEEIASLPEYKEEQESNEPKPSQPHIIDLEEGESPPRVIYEEDEPEITTVTAVQPPQDEDDALLASDEEFPELARKAREKARQKRLEAEAASATLDPSQSNTGEGSLQRSLSLQQPTPSPQQTDDIVSILITSRIANTTPLIVNRRISQRLKDVRVTWCGRQGFTPEATATVFLTWRGKRLFDVTTCKSLGIGVSADGTIVMKGEKDDLSEEERQIHMEAMTEEIFEDYKDSKRRAIADEDTEEGEKQEAEETEQKPEEQVRIILKAKGLDDFKLKVKPSTPISKIMNAFRSTYGVEADKEVFLLFDGERLERGSRVGESDISDMDSIEVHIK
ncbi:MAG: hypothetical protein FRX48_00709 [Lasallia pustulata]|uniref:Ubiquitin-like domain-containing protein n=1 Tax=Lasallia pustulata TaxID=136370 RepID=A0A5M8Q3K2_9LECA|nr:MAG: hypothetical protein FRX48_00709 [Lasallia pustulata]